MTIFLLLYRTIFLIVMENALLTLKAKEKSGNETRSVLILVSQ